jgi:hypothetical protein
MRSIRAPPDQQVERIAGVFAILEVTGRHRTANASNALLALNLPRVSPGSRLQEISQTRLNNSEELSIDEPYECPFRNRRTNHAGA